MHELNKSLIWLQAAGDAALVILLDPRSLLPVEDPGKGLISFAS